MIMVCRIMLVIAAIGGFMVAGVALTHSATLHAPVVTGGVDELARNVGAGSHEMCDPLCYGISDEDALDVTQAYSRGVRLFRKITPFDISMQMSTNATIRRNSPDSKRCKKPEDWQNDFRTPFEDWQRALRDDKGQILPDVEMMVSFERDWCMSTKENRRVTDDEYRSAIEAFDKQFPGVTIFTAWNEPNHPDQGYRNEKKNGYGGRKNLNRAHRAGRRFRVLDNFCTRRVPKCEVLAGDFAEVPKPNDRSWRKWLASYREGAQLNNSKPQMWALHPYTSVRERKGKRVRRFLQSVGPVSELWLTEAGAFHHLYELRNGAKEETYKDDPGRQYEDLKFLLGKLVRRKFKAPITRLYYYQWADQGKPHGTGLVRERTELEGAAFSSAMGRGQPFCLWHYRTMKPAQRAATCDPLRP